MKVYIGECYKPIVIKDHITDYSISTYGRVVKTDTRVEKLPYFVGNRKQYKRISIKGQYYYVHILVAKAFIPNPNKYPIVNHLDGKADILDNSIYNLEWTTYSGNSIHACETGLSTNLMGENNPHNKFSESTIHKVCADYEKGYTHTDLSIKYGMSIDLLHDIYNKKIWKNIVKDYTFTKKFRYNKTYSTDMKIEAYDLIKQGYPNDEIIRIMGLGYNSKINDFIFYVREAVYREEGSTTIEKPARRLSKVHHECDGNGELLYMGMKI